MLLDTLPQLLRQVVQLPLGTPSSPPEDDRIAGEVSYLAALLHDAELQDDAADARTTSRPSDVAVEVDVGDADDGVGIDVAASGEEKTAPVMGIISCR